MTKNTTANTLLIGGAVTTISALHYSAFNHYVKSAYMVNDLGFRKKSVSGYLLEGITGMNRENSFFRRAVYRATIEKNMYIQEEYPLKSGIAKSYGKMWGRLTVILGAATLLMTAICAYQNRK